LDIQISKVSIARKDGEITASNIHLDHKEHRASFTFPSFLGIGFGTLKIEFTGTLNEKMAGFYRSSYTTPSGEKRWAAVTQFEPTDARRAFPCWDEPALKAVFSVTLIAPADRLALSNMPVVSTTVSKTGKQIVKFADSPIMSTYLLAFVVGEFDYVEGTSAEGVHIKVYTPVGKKLQGCFALDMAIKTLSYYTKMFRIPYPLPKMDMIAIADFAAGAMENWGLITYREAALLIDEEKSSMATKQRVAHIVAHEISHQWFGNLVTMEWWTWLYLNEGFARWAQFLAVDAVHPEYQTWLQFNTGPLAQALSLDSLRNSHPVEVEVKHSAEIEEIFDAISYAKGASVIRMISSYLGEELFFKGLNHYLEKHKYRNAASTDLWSALASTSGMPIENMAYSWTKQVGYPVLQVNEDAAKSTDTKRVFKVKQLRFLAAGAVEDEHVWHIPIGIITQSAPSAIKYHVVNQREAVIEVDAKPTDWVKFNAGHTGFFRVQYSASLFAQLADAISSFGPADRLGLLNDTFALAKAGALSTGDFLRLCGRFSGESDYAVISELISGLDSLDNLLALEPVYPQLKAFLRSLYASLFNPVGWEAVPGEDSNRGMLRSMLVSRLGEVSDPAIVTAARARWTGDRSKIPADLRLAVFRIAIASGGPSDYDDVLKQYRDTDMSEEKRRCLQALGNSTDAALLQKTLDWALTEEVRNQDLMFPLGSVASNPLGREMAWNFLKTNWETLFKRYGEGSFLLSSILSSAASYFSSHEKATDIEEFFKAHPAPNAARTITQIVEKTRVNATWLQRDREGIVTALAGLVKN
jgi:puromycin-sensitive aminopeptidase